MNLNEFLRKKCPVDMGTSNYSERQHWLKIFPSIGKKCLYKIEPVLVYAIFHEIFVISLSFDYYFSFFPYRFKDVLPYDENRVKLAAGDKDNRNGYINASHVSGNKYIVCICTYIFLVSLFFVKSNFHCYLFQPQ